jgi:hypothetical protein
VQQIHWAIKVPPPRLRAVRDDGMATPQGPAHGDNARDNQANEHKGRENSHDSQADEDWAEIDVCSKHVKASFHAKVAIASTTVGGEPLQM